MWLGSYLRIFSYFDQFGDVFYDIFLEEDVFFLFLFFVIVRKVEQSFYFKFFRFYFIFCVQTVKIYGVRFQFCNMNMNDYEKFVVEMEDYMKKFDFNIILCLQQRFFVLNMEDSRNDLLVRFFYVFIIFGLFYESFESLTDNYSLESIIDFWQFKLNVKENINRRFGFYDNIVFDVYNEVNKFSIWLLNFWFNVFRREFFLDFQFVLYVGELGSESIGFRMVNQELFYVELLNYFLSLEFQSFNNVLVFVRVEIV